MTVLAILIVIGIVLIIFLLKKKHASEAIPETKKDTPLFNYKISREIKGIELLPFHIKTFERAMADNDLDLANLSFAKAIETVRQKNVDENNIHEDYLILLKEEYEKFRQNYNLEYPQQFIAPWERANKNTSQNSEIKQNNYNKALDYHFHLGEKISSHYKDRETGNNLEEAIKACEQQIEFALKAKSAFKYLYRGEPLPSHQGFTQLSIIKEKQNKFDEAINLCIKAKKQGWWEDWDHRIERLKKKQNKSSSAR